MVALSKFSQKFERAISRAFPDVDFRRITGEHDETVVTSLQYKRNKSYDGDGDH